MSWRAIAVGLCLAAAVASGTYFNDAVIRQTCLIGYYAPVSVLGAIGLAACGWPGMIFFRTFVPSVALPGYLEATHPDWTTAGALR